MLFSKSACYLIIANHQLPIKIFIEGNRGVNRAILDVIAYKHLLKWWLEISLIQSDQDIDIWIYECPFRYPFILRQSDHLLRSNTPQNVLLEINQTKLHFHKHIPKYNIGLFIFTITLEGWDILFISYVDRFTFDCISITFISIYESNYKKEAIYCYPTFNAECTRSRLK